MKKSARPPLPARVEPSRKLTGFSNGLGKNQPWKAAPYAATVNPANRAVTTILGMMRLTASPQLVVGFLSITGDSRPSSGFKTHSANRLDNHDDAGHDNGDDKVPGNRHTRKYCYIDRLIPGTVLFTAPPLAMQQQTIRSGLVHFEIRTERSGTLTPTSLGVLPVIVGCLVPKLGDHAFVRIHQSEIKRKPGIVHWCAPLQPQNTCVPRHVESAGQMFLGILLCGDPLLKYWRLSAGLKGPQEKQTIDQQENPSDGPHSFDPGRGSIWLAGVDPFHRGKLDRLPGGLLHLLMSHIAAAKDFHLRAGYFLVKIFRWLYQMRVTGLLADRGPPGDCAVHPPERQDPLFVNPESFSDRRSPSSW